MHEQSQQYNTREWFDNEFLETIYSKFETVTLNKVLFAEIVNKNYLH